MNLKRNFFDLSHYVFQCGMIGTLQTLSVIPVLAGDSLRIQAQNLIRLTALRRTLSVDAVVDLLAFYVPFRHVYGSLWTTLIEEGVDGVSTLQKLNIPSNGIYYLGQTMNPSSDDIALFMPASYNMIWNRYCRFKTLTPEIPNDYISSGYPTGHSSANSPCDGSLNMKQFGMMTVRLPMPWTRGIVGTLGASDRQASTAGDVLDVVDLLAAKKEYHTRIDREYLGQEYNDLLKAAFGSKGVNIDADQRPELLMRKTVTVNGYDVDGTDDASLGSSAGKGIANHNFEIPRRYFPEHGTVWLMIVVRFPTIGTREIMALSTGDQNYESLAGDEKVAISKVPEDQVLDKWQSAPAAGTDIGRVPWGEEWRHCHNVVHYLYESQTGYTFIKPQRFSTHVEAVYHEYDDYDAVFTSNALGHYQVNSTIRVDAWRHFPTAADSIWAGVG
jgi:hypothetical protein